ncbi:MAG: cold shock domain-containing protein [Bacteroidetes bacterium]|nr:cold shock domain-containing protein [Bacteroidota bacterium]
MGRSQESFNKKEVRNRKEKKRKEKAEKKLLRKDQEKNSFDNMIAYVDEFGNITATPPDPRRKTVINPDEIVIGATLREGTEGNQRERKGIVTHYNESKGYGFIRDLKTGESVFVHANSLSEPIAVGNSVSFEIGQGQKGPAANNVTILR